MPHGTRLMFGGICVFSKPYTVREGDCIGLNNFPRFDALYRQIYVGFWAPFISPISYYWAVNGIILKVRAFHSGKAGQGWQNTVTLLFCVLEWYYRSCPYCGSGCVCFTYLTAVVVPLVSFFRG